MKGKHAVHWTVRDENIRNETAEISSNCIIGHNAGRGSGLFTSLSDLPSLSHLTFANQGASLDDFAGISP